MLPATELRERVKKLAKQKLGEGPALIQFHALLYRARLATEERNEILHSFWGTEQVNVVIRDRHNLYKKAPTLTELNKLASDLEALRVRFEIQGWAFLRMRMPPMATRIMA